MTFGLKMIGDTGAVVIDADYRNYCLIAKGAQTTSATPQNLAYITTFSIPAITPTCMIATSGTNSAVIAYIDYGAKTLTIFSYAAGVTVNWWLFDLLPAPSADLMGSRIWDAAGALVYDTGNKPMRAWANVSFNPSSFAMGANGSFYTLGAGATSLTIAAVQNSLPVAVRSGHVSGMGAEPNYVYAAAYTHTAGANPGVQQLRCGGFGGSQDYVSNRAGSFLLIDVTGY